MDILTLKKAQRHTNEQVIQKATNSPTQTVSFDGGVYSLPSNVVNGQVSDVVVKGLSLKNELNYDRDTWVEWEKDTGVVGDNTGLEFTADGTNNKSAKINTKIKPSAQYGILFNVVSSTITGVLNVFNASAFQTKTLTNAVGNYKAILTSNADITNNRLYLYISANTSGQKIKIRDVRIFELPTGSQIESDFTNLTADQLAQKYPYINGDSVKSTVGDGLRLVSRGKNIIDKTKLIDNSYVSMTDGLFKSTETLFRSDFTLVKGLSNVYYKTGSTSMTTGVAFYDANKKFISSIPTDNFKDTGIVPIPSNAVYAVFDFYKSAWDFDNAMVSTVPLPVSYEPYKLSQVYISAGGELRSVSGVKDEFNVTTGVKTQRNGTKTNVNSGTVINYADMATGGQFVAYAADGTSQVGVKGDTLTITAVSLTYQLATPIVTKLTPQKLEVFENGTIYVEPIGDPAESTLPSVELTVPVGQGNQYGIATHDYQAAAADWVLSSNEAKCMLLKTTNAGAAVNIIAPDRPGVLYAVNNTSGQAVTIKKSGGTGVAIVTGKTALVMHNGTDYIKLTGEV